MQWGERYLYRPSILQKLLSYLLLPLSALYCWIAYLRYRRSVPVAFGIPVVSVGNLTVGGSGKTPLVIELARRFARPAVVLRGYGRSSRGLVVVRDGEILCDVETSGDEAMLYATSLEHAIVIVSERREEAIVQARARGCEVVLLDDGYGKHAIEKLDLLIEVETPNDFCLPSGPYREKLWSGKNAVSVREGREFVRKVRVANATDNMVLVTAIARPERLDPFLPEVADKICFEDHHRFTEAELREIASRTGSTSLLVTQKDFVKIAPMKIECSVLELSLDVDEALITRVKEYVYAKKD